MIVQEHLTPARSASSADWLVRPFGGPPLLVSTFVPDKFPSVVRVLNPLIDAAGRPTPWGTIAQELGISLEQVTNADRLCQDYLAKTGERINIDYGSLSHDVAATLADVLSRHTSTPDQCFFTVWTGYSGIRNELTGAPVVMLPPEREMYLLEGTTSAATETVDEPPSRRSLRWWPADHTWCVGNDIYADSVYVAGSQECISDLLHETRLETLAAAYTDPHPGIYA
jgi:hypothetical protein